jgi:predicted GNAT superfamily acetyltransferase
MVTIRDLRGAHELRAAQDLQRQAWGITEDGYVLPVATMAAAQRFGGLVLGAFDTAGAQERLVGFAFAFLGRVRDCLVLYSQLTGVHPAQQGSGVGRQLKYAQRQRARDMGLELVVWAFDPLQASNAAFNMAVLGATSRIYEVDMYGARSDTLNAGMATDRLLAEWRTAGELVPHREAWADSVELLETRSAAASGLRSVVARHAPPEHARHLTVEVPPNIQQLKARGPRQAADEWQLALRHAFLDAFAQGFVVVGFSRADAERPRYLLERVPDR